MRGSGPAASEIFPAVWTGGEENPLLGGRDTL